MDDIWSDHAACREAPDPNRFVEASTAKEELLLISAYCSVCPVVDLCFEAAMETPIASDVGIWGGTTEAQRRITRRRRRNATQTGA